MTKWRILETPEGNKTGNDRPHRRREGVGQLAKRRKEEKEKEVGNARLPAH